MTTLLSWLTGTAGYAAIGVALLLAVLTHFAAPRAWSALAWAVAFATLAGAFVAQREITASVRAEHDAYRLAIAQADAAAEAQARHLEKELRNEIDSNQAQTAKVITDLLVDRSRADAAGQRLHQQTAALRARIPSANSDAATRLASATTALDLLTELLRESDERTGVLAGALDASHAAGKSCERDYDAVKRVSEGRAQ